MRLLTRQVQKPWGRDTLPFHRDGSEGRRIGEIWYEDPARPDLPLLPKLLFTSERLSIQVHPSGEAAGIPGLHGVRAECWYVVDATDDASVAYGFNRRVTKDQIRAAALDGTLSDLLTWHPVHAGDFIFVPSGAVHAIGAGLTIVEFQQSFDVTYRLFDYGRGRPLQLDAALEAMDLGPPETSNFRHIDGDGDQLLVAGPQFTVASVSTGVGADWMSDRQRWIMPLTGTVQGRSEQASFGDCLLLEAGDRLELGAAAVALVAADGPFEPPSVTRR